MLAVDSAGRLSGLAVRQERYSIAARYIVGAYAMAFTEVEDLCAHSIGIVSIAEVQAQAALGGAGAGTEAAWTAGSSAIRLKQPRGSAIYCAVDFEPTAAQMPEVVAYCRAFVQGCHQDDFDGGVYGGTSVMQAVAGIADYRWQAAGWSNGVQVSGVHLRQGLTQATVGGVTCDVDEVLIEHCGAWTLAGLWPATVPKPEDNVTLHDIPVTLKAGNRQATEPTTVPYAKAFGPTVLEGPGFPAVIPSIADSNGNAVVVVKVDSPPPADLVVTVRIAEGA